MSFFIFVNYIVIFSGMVGSELGEIDVRPNYPTQSIDR
jgi:hypothetical protein